MPHAVFRAGRTWVVAAALAALTVSLAVAPAAASAPTGSVSASNRTGDYTNPLAPSVGEKSVLESCADPAVLRGQRTGDTNWYLYCTTDPLNDEDVDAAGEPVFARVPAFSSQNLVDWTYAGESFSGPPSWADPSSALWAPDVVYSSTFDQYYLFTVVTNTSDETSGVPGCASDSAIAVATSASATGPWTFSDQPVVGPRQNGPGCDFLWTYDPDVLGDTIADSGYFYYGSYYGGISATTIAFDAAGATADLASATLVGIDNKYEGANVIERDGYYYLFASATNCCNGALTGYSVFVGRATDPLGPFVDKEGVSLAAERAGGTPFLTMNGNRWTGPGHNSTFTDAHGDWWTAYHAIDREDPYFAFETGFTKRPVLLDPVEWVDGWPRVNGGQGPSIDRQNAPAAQDGQDSRQRFRAAEVAEPRRLLQEYSDEFDAAVLGAAWSWQKPAGGEILDDGVLRLPVQAGDLYVDANSAAVLLRGAPRADFLVEAKVRLNAPTGCCQNFAQVGVLLYQDDDNYIKLTETSIWNTRQTEFAKETAPVPEGWARYGNTVVGPPGADWTYLRVAVERLTGGDRRDALGDTYGYTAYTSQDGQTWVKGATWTNSPTRDLQIGLAAYGLQDPAVQLTAEFDYVRVSTFRERRG